MNRKLNPYSSGQVLLSQMETCLRYPLLFAMLLLFCGALNSAAAQGTSFTYQGRLQDSGTNANGNYDLQFTLWDSLSGGTQQPQPSPVTVTRTSVPVANGVFTVQLDFGASAFPGADRFLETSVRLAGGGAFTLLSPRQPITSTPYAIRSASASAADAATNATQLGGVAANQYVQTVDARLSDPRAPTAGSANYIQNTTSPQPSSNFNITGNGTAGGTLSGNVVNSSTQFNLAGNRVLSSPGTNNLFAGIGSGAANTTGNSNAFFGSSAGANNTSGTANSFFGSFVGSAITTGSNNSFFGVGAGANSTTASANSFFGKNAGVANTTGSDNSFFGNGAGFNTNTGIFNAFFGESAGGANTSGGNNTFVGASAGPSNTTGMRNSFLGYNSGFSHATGNGNTLIGYAAGDSDVSGNNNTGLGNLATFGSNNLTNATAIGANARVDQSNALVLGSINGINSATASTNVGIGTTTPTERLHVVGNGLFTGSLTAGSVLNLNGQLALSNAGTQNLFAGSGAGQTNSGTNNAFFGYQAGVTNSTGSNNAFFGRLAGASNDVGNLNSFFGTQAGVQNTSGNNNAFFGRNAGSANTTNSFNAYFGTNTGANSDACCNSMFGNAAGASNTTGQNNSFFGDVAGNTNISGNSNTAIGASADFGSSTLTNATAIGFRAMVSQDNSLVLGSIAGVNASVSSTNVGIGTTTPTARLHVVGDTNLVGNLDVQNTAGTALLRVRSTGGSGVLYLDRAAAIPTNSSQLSFYTAGNPDFTLGTSQGSAGNSDLSIYNYGTASNAFTILKSTGNVGIATTGPSFKLHVNGETRTNLLSIDNFVSNSGGPTLCASTTTNRVGLCSSSLRYKTNVQTFRSGLDIINRLHPISFNWKDGGMHDIGLAAEEVNRVEPLLAFRNNKGEIEGVRYTQLSAVFINAFKEQQSQIEKQQQELKRQQELIAKQETEAREQRAMFTTQQQQIEALKKLVCRSHRRAAGCR